MKHVITILGFTLAIVVVVLVFCFHSQKEQNSHVEKMAELVAKTTTQNQSATIEVIPVEEKSLREKMFEGLKSVLGFVLSVFSKV